MMAQNNTSIKGIVMSRVHTIHALQMIFNATVVSVGVFILALYGIGREVWVSRVLQNMPSPMNVADFGALVHFYLAAFMDTRFIVQVLAILALGAFIWLGYNFFQMLKVTRTSMRFA
jgi:hypothetical protein